jgi:uncharacterized protein YbjT (DUF2867 family)
MMRNVLIAGATGLIGKELVSLLIRSEHYNSVHIVIRRPYNLQHRKISSYIVDFENLHDFKPDAVIHDVYICLGTTMKKAGNKTNFKKVDYDYVVSVAKWAKENNVEKLAIVSSIGAGSNSKSTFYLRVKGQVEQALQDLGFRNLIILRPSLLLGKREEFRFGELMAKLIIKPFASLMTGKLKKYRPVEAGNVAAAMIYHTIKSSAPLSIVENDKILEIDQKMF